MAESLQEFVVARRRGGGQPSHGAARDHFFGATISVMRPTPCRLSIRLPLRGLATEAFAAVVVASSWALGALQGLRSTATSSSSARPRLRFALVTTQIALTLALLGGSALLLRSLWNVVSVPLGFDAERVITVTARLSRVRYPTVEHGAVFFEELLARARAMPGAVSVALSDSSPPPLSSGAAWTGWEVEGRPVEPNGPVIRIRSVMPHYF